MSTSCDDGGDDASSTAPCSSSSRRGTNTMIDESPLPKKTGSAGPSRRSSFLTRRFSNTEREKDGSTASSSSTSPPPTLFHRGSLGRSPKKDVLETALKKIRMSEQLILEKDKTILHLRKTVNALSKKLKGVAQFIDLRDDIEERLNGMERRHDEEIKKYKSQATDARFDLIEKKIHLKVEEKKLKEGFEQEVAQKASALLSGRTKAINLQNFELLKDKLLLTQEVEDTRVKCDALEKENASLRTELKVVSASEKECLKRSTAFKKQVETLKKEVMSTEDRLDEVVKEFTVRMERQTKHYDKKCRIVEEERDAARFDALNLQAELQRLRAASSTVLGRYQDIQWFFHDALRQVRMEIMAERRNEIVQLADVAHRQAGVGKNREDGWRRGIAYHNDHSSASFARPGAITMGPHRHTSKTSKPFTTEDESLLLLPPSPPAAAAAVAPLQLLPTSSSSSSPIPTQQIRSPPGKGSSPSLRDHPAKSFIDHLEFDTSLHGPLLLTYENGSCSPPSPPGEPGSGGSGADTSINNAEKGFSKMDGSLESNPKWLPSSGCELLGPKAGSSPSKARFENHHSSSGGSERSMAAASNSNSMIHSGPVNSGKEEEMREKTVVSERYVLVEDNREVGRDGTAVVATTTSSPGAVEFPPCFSLSGGGLTSMNHLMRSKREWGRDKRGFPILLSTPEDPILHALLPPLGGSPSSAANIMKGKASGEKQKAKVGEAEKSKRKIIGENVGLPGQQEKKKGKKDAEDGRLMDILAERWGASLSRSNAGRVMEKFRHEMTHAERSKEGKVRTSGPLALRDVDVVVGNENVVALHSTPPAPPSHPSQPLSSGEGGGCPRIDVRQMTWAEKERVIYYLFRRLQQQPRRLEQRQKSSNHSSNGASPNEEETFTTFTAETNRTSQDLGMVMAEGERDAGLNEEVENSSSFTRENECPYGNSAAKTFLTQL